MTERVAPICRLDDPDQWNQRKNKINAYFALFNFFVKNARSAKAHGHEPARLRNLGKRLVKLLGPMLACRYRPRKTHRGV
jgi:hypothetical protein